jgi:hypothetical protein
MYLVIDAKSSKLIRGRYTSLDHRLTSTRLRTQAGPHPILYVGERIQALGRPRRLRTGPSNPSDEATKTFALVEQMIERASLERGTRLFTGRPTGRRGFSPASGQVLKLFASLNQDRRAVCCGLIPTDNHVDVEWIKLHATADSGGLLGRDESRSRAAERVDDGVAAIAEVEQRPEMIV